MGKDRRRGLDADVCFASKADLASAPDFDRQRSQVRIEVHCRRRPVQVRDTGTLPVDGACLVGQRVLNRHRDRGPDSVGSCKNQLRGSIELIVDQAQLAGVAAELLKVGCRWLTGWWQILVKVGRQL